MNKNLLTYNAATSQVGQTYYSPVATISGSNKNITEMYCFLSLVDPWVNDASPEQPRQDQKYLKSIFKNIFVARKIKSNDISPVIKRHDWVYNTIYHQYQDNIDMFQKNINGDNQYNFYIKNRYDQVFKCLCNNKGQPSLHEPYFQPGTYGTNNIFKDADGYKWKYIYTVDMGAKTKFMDQNWMPIPIGVNTPNPIQTSAGCGDIEVINVVNGGTGYNPSLGIITVSITGDGTGAAATVETSGNVITDIIVTNAGTNYTYANVAITYTANTGLGATANAFTSPIGGHGFDPVSEFGCNHVMFISEFNSNEKGLVPTDIQYHQVGLLVNPTALSTYPNKANSDIYSTTTDLIVASGFGLYTNGEIIYQGSTIDTATFKATIVSFDPASDVLKLINITGTPILNTAIYGNSSKCVRTVLITNYPDFVLQSGYLSYIENRSSIQRSYDGIEQFKFVLSY